MTQDIPLTCAQILFTKYQVISQYAQNLVLFCLFVALSNSLTLAETKVLMVCDAFETTAMTF